MSPSISMQPITEILTQTAKHIWKEESRRLVQELTERVTARLLALEQELKVEYQMDVALREAKLYVCLPPETEILK